MQVSLAAAALSGDLPAVSIILSFLGLAVSTHQDKQRLGGFLRNIKSAAEKLQKEGKIIIEDRVDRYLYFPVQEKMEVIKDE